MLSHFLNMLDYYGSYIDVTTKNNGKELHITYIDICDIKHSIIIEHNYFTNVEINGIKYKNFTNIDESIYFIIDKILNSNIEILNIDKNTENYLKNIIDKQYNNIDLYPFVINILFNLQINDMLST